LPALLTLCNDPEPAVRLQLLLTLSAVPEADADDALAALLVSNHDIPRDLARDCALSGLAGREFEFLKRLLDKSEWKEASVARADLVTNLARCVWAEHRQTMVRQL